MHYTVFIHHSRELSEALIQDLVGPRFRYSMYKQGMDTVVKCRDQEEADLLKASLDYPGVHAQVLRDDLPEHI